MRHILLWAGLGAGVVAASGLVPPDAGPVEGSSREAGGPGGGLGMPLHAEGPPAGHTGGFGEPTCVVCHAEFPLNDGGGSLRLEGLPESYEPGRGYALSIVLEVPETARAGFQIAARSPEGEQAGSWTPLDARVAVVDSAGVAYAHSTRLGVDPESSDRARWQVLWTAPEGGAVRIHLAANSANGDDSPFGDLVYALEATLEGFR